jgi:hypothetical protein
MNITTITRTSSAQWLGRGIVAAGALLIASATIAWQIVRPWMARRPPSLPRV